MYLYVCAHVRTHTPDVVAATCRRAWSSRRQTVSLCRASHLRLVCVVAELAPVTPFTLSRVPHRVPSGNRQGVALLPPRHGVASRE